MADLKQYSILLACSDVDIDQGEFREVVRAANAEEAEAKGRAAMRAWHVANYCDPDGDANDIAESCAQYEHEEFDGEVIFGGRVLDVHEGAIWKAHDLEFRLRGLLAAIDQWSSRNGWSDNGEREAARMVIAEIESLGGWESTTSPVK